MLISGNSIRSVIPIIVYLVSTSNDLLFLDTSNNVVSNSKLQTLVLADIHNEGGGIAALGSSKRYTVDGITYTVDFTRFM